jgi:serine/threonine protein kinase
MSKLKSPVTLETAFTAYTVTELLGEGGAGRVYGGTSAEGDHVAVKVLSAPSTDKRRRFKNEISFLQRNTHANIVTVQDTGVAHIGSQFNGPFYVMKRYDGSLRDLMKAGIGHDQILKLFFQILDGVEAAHLKNVIHRDLKPENILYDRKSNTLAIADFGIARFTEDVLATMVQTAPTQRLANFQYAAPEQRVLGKQITQAADIYALGLMLNELFTGSLPLGTGYQLIGSVSKVESYLDDIVERMIKQSPGDRPPTIADIKGLFLKYQDQAISLQRISRIDGTVITSGTIDVPLAQEPPRVINAEWSNNRLTLTLDRPVTSDWVNALRNMGSYASIMGAGPGDFTFNGDIASVSARPDAAQMIIDHFKSWLPRASETLKYALQQASEKAERDAKEKLRVERAVAEQRLQVNHNLRI